MDSVAIFQDSNGIVYKSCSVLRVMKCAFKDSLLFLAEENKQRFFYILIKKEKGKTLFQRNLGVESQFLLSKKVRWG